jgi:hypothetical protein
MKTQPFAIFSRGNMSQADAMDGVLKLMRIEKQVGLIYVDGKLIRGRLMVAEHRKKRR